MRASAMMPILFGGAMLVACEAPTSVGTTGPVTAGATAGATVAALTGAPATAVATARPRPEPKPDAKVSSVSGDVQLTGADGTRSPVTAGQELAVGTTLWVAAGASVVLVLEDEGQVTLTGPVVAGLTHNERREWSVLSGKAEFNVRRAVGRDSFQVRTVAGLFRLKGGPPPNSGAALAVTVADDGATRVAVAEGLVELIDEDAEFQMELDRAEEIRSRAAEGPGAMPTSLRPPAPRATIEAGRAVEIDGRGKPGKVLDVAPEDDVAAWLDKHAAGAKPAKVMNAHIQSMDKLLAAAGKLMKKSDDIRNSHKELLEKARAARDAKDDAASRRLKATLVANTRQARALGRWAHRDVTVATLRLHAVEHLVAAAEDSPALARPAEKIAEGSPLRTTLADLTKRTMGLRRRPKVAMPGMPMPHRRGITVGGRGPKGGVSITARPGVPLRPAFTARRSGTPAPPLTGRLAPTAAPPSRP